LASGITTLSLHDALPIWEHMADVKRVSEREMFGGVSFMVAGNLCCGVLGDDLIVRIDPTLHHDALTRPGAREFEMGGRSSRGMIDRKSTRLNSSHLGISY